MFDDLIQSAAAVNAVPESWIRATIDVESAWNPDAYRAEPKINDGSYGLMQLLERTARNLGFTGDVAELFDPATNIEWGAKLLGDLRRRYGDDFRLVYSAYNSGNPNLWQSSPEVAAHVERALIALEKYVVASVETVTGGQTVIGALVVLVLLWAWAGKRRR
jgi:soluble lytic murein transglycosylase-like protein